MKRRDFILKSTSAGIIAGTGLMFGDIGRLFAAVPPSSEGPYDMVAVKGGEAAEMFDKAIESMGGMGKYVKNGQKVVVKPNIGWDVSPERAGNTNPFLVKRIVEQCFDAGASDVYVFDNTCDEWGQCYQNSGIEKAVKEAGGHLVPANKESDYREIEIKNAKKLKTAAVHKLILDSDVFINVPVLKHHSSASLSLAMKNLMGIVWDRMFWHKNDLHQCIAEFPLAVKPDLNVVDGYRVMLRNGPRGVSVADVKVYKQLLLSEDVVAIDAAAAKIFGSEPADIPYINIADSLGLGTMNLSSLAINRIIL